MISNLKDYGFIIDPKLKLQYSDNPDMFLNTSAAEALVKARNKLPVGYNYIIRDGLRTLEEQRNIVKTTAKELKQEGYKNWKQLLKDYTGGYGELRLKHISDMNHRSGNAVDISIADNNGKELNMGGVTLTPRDHLNHHTKGKIYNNRKLLKDSLGSVGFIPYPKEWWHWGIKTATEYIKRIT